MVTNYLPHIYIMDTLINKPYVQKQLDKSFTLFAHDETTTFCDSYLEANIISWFLLASQTRPP
jgi:hypothetical protein